MQLNQEQLICKFGFWWQMLSFGGNHECKHFRAQNLGQKDVKERKRNMANMMMVVDELTPLGLLNPVMSADFEAALTETGTMGLVRLIATAEESNIMNAATGRGL